MTKFLTWLNTQFEWLKGMFSEHNGKASLKRIGAFALIATFVSAYLKIAIPSKVLLDIPDTWAFLLGGVILGLGLVSKIKDKND